LPDQWLNRGWRGSASDRVLIHKFAYTLLPLSIKLVSPCVSERGCSWLVVRWSLASAWWSGRRSRRGRLIVGRSGRLVAGLGSCGARSGGRGTSRRSEEEARSSSSHPRLPPRTDQASHFPPPPRASTISLPHSALRKCRKPRSRRGATTRAGARGASRGPHRGRLGVEGGPQGTTTRSGKSRLFFLWGLCK